MDLTVICHGSKFSKSLDNPPHDVLRNIVKGAVAFVDVFDLPIAAFEKRDTLEHDDKCDWLLLDPGVCTFC